MRRALFLLLCVIVCASALRGASVSELRRVALLVLEPDEEELRGRLEPRIRDDDPAIRAIAARVAAAKKMFNALKRLEREAELAVYAGEGHVRARGLW
ncbi:MAG: hypothetical protein ACRD2J_14295 [Thermoanaerobaculia bacterium]